MQEELNNEEQTLSNYDPFSRPFIDHYQSEREAKVYLTREDINALGFLRSNPERNIYQHSNNPNLYLEISFERDYKVKDEVVERIKVYHRTTFVTGITAVLYSSTKPNKEDIQLVISNYAA